MESPNNDSANNSPSPSPSPSPKRSTPSPSHALQPKSNSQDSAATAGNQLKKLSKRTLRIPKQGSPSPAEGLVQVPVIALVSGKGGSATVVEATAERTSRVKNVDDQARGRSKKIKLLLKRKPAEASSSPERSICRFCLGQFPTRTTLLDHLQMEHPTTQEQVHDQTPDHHKGEDNGGGDRKSEELEGSSAATEGHNNGFDLNQPMEVSAEINQVEDACGDDTIDGPRKKFRFDLNEFPSLEDEDDNKP